MIIFKTLFKTLNKNASSFTITDEAISDNSIFEVYPSDDSVILADVQVIGTTANIVFDSTAEYNIPCAVFINNLVGAYEPEIDHIDANNVYYENPFTGEQPIGSHFADLELNYEGYALPLLNNINDELHTDTVLGGVLYNSSTGNIWKKLDASNLDYDADSTIYSAMGDIDELETESKNLVGAINELYENYSADIYDNNERVIGSWFGQPLYRKAYNFENRSLISGTNNVLFSLPNIIPRKVNIIISNSAHTVYSQWEGSRDNNQILWDFTNGDFVLRTLTNWGTPNIFVIIEYTKVGV